MSAKSRNIVVILVLTAAIATAVILAIIFSSPKEPRMDKRASVQVPILLYHHIADENQGENIISMELFKSHLDALKAQGYETVSFQQLLDYVETGAALPEKPVVINFDDGYTSNYDFAWPALVERDMKATIFVIGCSVGKDTYKDTGLKMKPHFSYDQAQEMIDSGLISIQPHTYDMHKHKPYESENSRTGLLPLDGESEADYRQALKDDLTRAIEKLEENTSEKVYALAYPSGKFTEISEEVCSELGISITLTTKPAVNTVVKGAPSCLRLMSRYTIPSCSSQELLALLANCS